jgi:pimeloyl-ACP methyl ester carboxylesterase
VLAPERITRLVLVGAGLSSVNEVMRDLERAVQALEDPVPRAFVHEFQHSCVARPLPVPFMEKVIAESLKLDAATWKAVLRGLMSYVAAEASIDLPVLVLGGDRDAVFSAPEQRALVERLPNATLRLFEGVGHTPHWEDPQRFASELLAVVGAM